MADITLPPINFADLDDTHPAGEYSKPIDEMGLRLVCLAIIRQAVMDARANDEQALHAKVWLSEVPRWWLKALSISRGGCEGEIYRLIYGGGCQQRPLEMEEEGDEQ